MHVAVTRPGQTDTEGLTVPVIYETSPYYSGVAGIDFDHFWNLRQEVGGDPPARDPFPATIRHIERQPVISNSHIRTWVPRGFAVIHSQSPGTGQSQGCPTVGGANESLAPKAVIDWLNGRARGFTTVDGTEQVEAYWSTGKVGMTGTSYNGTLPLAAATTGVDGLEAIIPVAPNTSYYHYYRSNGLVRSPGGYPGEDIDVLFDFIFSGYPDVRDYCIAHVRDEMYAELDRTTGDYNDFWAGRDYLNHIDGVRAATLMAHAFNDWNVMPEHSYRITEALKARGVPVQIYYHQGGHGGPPPLELMNRWFTRYVLGVENAVENDPRAWIVREADDRQQPTPYPDYPHPEAEGVPLHPAGDGNWTGTLSLNAGDLTTGDLTTGDADGTGGIVDNFAFEGGQLAAAEWSNHRLLYATPLLQQDVHLLRRGHGPRARGLRCSRGESDRLARLAPLDRRRRHQRQHHHQGLGGSGQRGRDGHRGSTVRHRPHARRVRRTGIPAATRRSGDPGGGADRADGVFERQVLHVAPGAGDGADGGSGWHECGVAGGGGRGGAEEGAQAGELKGAASITVGWRRTASPARPASASLSWNSRNSADSDRVRVYRPAPVGGVESSRCAPNPQCSGNGQMATNAAAWSRTRSDA